MSAVKQMVDHKLLRSLSPLCDLTPDMLTELSAKSSVEQVPSGATIFRAGERDHRTLYLISGKLELTDRTGRSTILNSNSHQARQPLDPETPRSLTAVSKGQVTLLNIDTSLLEMLLNWRGNNQSYEVSNLDAADEGETDWMSRFLQSRVFLKLRAENIQAMMMRMEEIEVKTDDVIINQGDLDENYYIIAKGKAKVARQASPDAPMMKLAILTAGSGFGEEALIGNCKRNASVIMMEDGKLMRLAKDDFIELLVAPVLQYLTYEEARAIESEDVKWLDVRKLDEFSRGTIPGAINTPAAELRLSLRKLNKLHKYIVFSDTDDLAASSVFLLNQNGLDAYVLKNGLAEIPKQARQKPATPAPKEPPATDNVVNLHNESGTPAEDRTEALKQAAKKRVQQEMQRAQSSEEARKKAQDEVERLRSEVEVARKQAEKAQQDAKKIISKARTEVERLAAQKLVEEMTAEQAQREEALKRAEVEAARAKMAEAAHEQAEAEIKRLKQEAVYARRDAEEEVRQAADRAKKEAEEEIIRLKAEAEIARQHAQEQARLAADKARSEAERESAQKKLKESTRYQQEMEGALKRAEMEAMRAEQSEAARRAAEEEAERMRIKAEETQREMEKQARMAADVARSEAEREIARQRAEELATKQQEIEEAVRKAEAESARAQVAEEEVERLRSQAEESRRKADAEIQRLKVDAEVARMQMEEQAQRVADAARSDAEREAARARAAEAARLQAEEELERLAAQAAQARLESEAQARLAADQARSEAEREAAHLRAEELAEQQRQLEEIANRAEEEAARAQLADEARQRAENEIARRQQQAEEAARRAEEEARRAWEAEDARRKMEEEVAQLRAEAEAARAQMEEQAKRFADSQRINAEDMRRRAEEDMAAEAKRLADENAEKRKKEAEETARKAAEEAEKARLEAERLQQESAVDIKRLQAEAEAARIQAEIELKRSIAAARREVDQNAAKQKALARTKRAAAMPMGHSANDRGQRARAARAAQAAHTEAMEALSVEVNELEGFFADVNVDLPGGNGSSGTADPVESDLESVNIMDNEDLLDPTINDNLIDPTKDDGDGSKGKKKGFISDDLAWEASVGYRKDPSVEHFDGSSSGQKKEPVPEVSEAKPKPEVQPDMPTESRPASGPSMFKSQDINRSIRPQAVKPTGRSTGGSSLSKGKLFIGVLFVLICVGTGGWFYSQQAGAPKELRQVVNKSTESLSNITRKVATTIDELKAELGIEGEVSESEMVELRERLQKIKEESARSAQKLAKERKESAKNNVVAEKPVKVAAPVKAAPSPSPVLTNTTPTATSQVTGKQTEKTVDEVLNELSTSDTKQADQTSPSAVAEQSGQQPASAPASVEDQVKTVDSVDSLPVIDEGEAAATTAVENAASATEPVTSSESSAEEPASVSVTPAE